ncbi:hypothetical protein FGO68_gene8655 [Halteria grandinella]|uniref:COMM domain-containing protein n=1 Tax=Halteria grandinella TaxID=5974 RepID=A0A8J8T9M9_HALGN|nr:hypothetical protein FGO68_gene8655 [Halteria grandinella]
MADLSIPQSSLADLSYLRQMSPIIAQFLVSEVARFQSKRAQGNLDILKISRELENEGVELSNEKILTVLRALKAIIFKVLKAGSQSVESQTVALQTLQVILTERCSFKEKMVNAIISQLQVEFQALNQFQAENSLKTFFDQIKLKKLVSFDCLLSHDFATLVFKISEADGQTRVRTLEVTLEELKQFKEEIVRIEETLS